MEKLAAKKKFFSTLSLTSPSRHKPLRYAFDDSCSEMGYHEKVGTTRQYRNPIIPFIRYSAEKDELINLYLIVCIGDSQDGRMVLSDDEEWDVEKLVDLQKKKYIEEVEEAKKDIGFEYELEIIYVEGTKNNSHLKLIKDIVSNVEDNDTVFMDITYGIRTIIISQFLSLTYCYKVRQGTSVGALSYGQKYGSHKPRIYNLSEFFLFNQTINNLGDLPTPGPLVDRILLNLIEGDEDDA